MRDHPDRIPTLIHYINISRQLERIADLATNIAEDVIYTAKGKLVRHKHS
jgi:phosphate transport system protein